MFNRKNTFCIKVLIYSALLNWISKCSSTTPWSINLASYGGKSGFSIKKKTEISPRGSVCWWAEIMRLERILIVLYIYLELLIITKVWRARQFDINKCITFSVQLGWWHSWWGLQRYGMNRWQWLMIGRGQQCREHHAVSRPSPWQQHARTLWSTTLKLVLRCVAPKRIPDLPWQTSIWQAVPKPAKKRDHLHHDCIPTRDRRVEKKQQR